MKGDYLPGTTSPRLRIPKWSGMFEPLPRRRGAQIIILLIQLPTFSLEAAIRKYSSANQDKILIPSIISQNPVLPGDQCPR